VYEPAWTLQDLEGNQKGVKSMIFDYNFRYRNRQGPRSWPATLQGVGASAGESPRKLRNFRIQSNLRRKRAEGREDHPVDGAVSAARFRESQVTGGVERKDSRASFRGGSPLVLHEFVTFSPFTSNPTKKPKKKKQHRKTRGPPPPQRGRPKHWESRASLLKLLLWCAGRGWPRQPFETLQLPRIDGMEGSIPRA